MTAPFPLRRITAAGFALAGALLLSGCLLSPGRFVSTLDIRKDGRFAFAYTGEIHMLALSRLAEMEANKPFAPSPCYTDDTGQERECTKADLTSQKGAWEEERKSSAERRKREGAQMKALLGGIDPTDPRAAEELAQRLRRQVGWKKVIYKGDGLFDIDFSVAGRLDHDFAFPTIERFPTANAFVTLALRQDGTVRIDAPGFAPAAGGEPFRSMMMGMAGSTKIGPSEKDLPPGMPVIDGTFAVTTDAAVLANNTDEGPQLDTAGQRLAWTVNLRSGAAPMALVRLAK